MRTRICKNCEKIFTVQTGKTSYLCEECAQKSKSNSVLRERTCKICGVSFMGYPRSFFCPDCRLERKKQQKKIYNQRKPTRPLGSTDICDVCGKMYIVKSGRQKYCLECATEQVNKNVRAHKREYMAENKGKNRMLKKETRGKRYICVVCGKEYEKHTTGVTCSPECHNEYIRQKRKESDIKRGRYKAQNSQ